MQWFKGLLYIYAVTECDWTQDSQATFPSDKLEELGATLETFFSLPLITCIVSKHFEERKKVLILDLLLFSLCSSVPDKRRKRCAPTHWEWACVLWGFSFTAVVAWSHNSQYCLKQNCQFMILLIVMNACVLHVVWGPVSSLNLQPWVKVCKTMFQTSCKKILN